MMQWYRTIDTILRKRKKKQEWPLVRTGLFLSLLLWPQDTIQD